MGCSENTAHEFILTHTHAHTHTVCSALWSAAVGAAALMGVTAFKK